MPMTSNPIKFNGYSRAYATPQLQWYSLMVQSSNEPSGEGLIGLYFDPSGNIEFWGFRVNTIPVFKFLTNKQRVYYDDTTGVKENRVIIREENLVTGNRIAKSLYGLSSQIIFSPISSANNTNVGEISLTT